MSCQLFLFFAIPLLNHSDSDTEIKKKVLQDVQSHEKAILAYVDSHGSDKEKAAYEVVTTTRQKVVAHGTLTIQAVTKLLMHKQVNVRRGAAITLSIIVDKNAIDDEKLLDKVLLRMVEDPDIKCRSNLYHVVNGIIANIKKR